MCGSYIRWNWSNISEMDHLSRYHQPCYQDLVGVIGNVGYCKTNYFSLKIIVTIYFHTESTQHTTHKGRATVSKRFTTTNLTVEHHFLHLESLWGSRLHAILLVSRDFLTTLVNHTHFWRCDNRLHHDLSRASDGAGVLNIQVTNAFPINTITQVSINLHLKRPGRNTEYQFVRTSTWNRLKIMLQYNSPKIRTKI